MRDVGEKLKEYVPDISETELGKKVSKTVSEAESKIMENTNFYQYGGFKSRIDREKLKEKLLESPTETVNENDTSVPENPEAGASLVTTKESTISKFWTRVKESNPLTTSNSVFYMGLLIYYLYYC